MNFEDLFYQQIAQAGSLNNANDMKPAGIMVGLGTRVASTQLDFTQGSAIKTDGPLDMFIKGDGFFKIKVLSGQGDGIAYTRTGKFVPDQNGALVLNLGDGYKMEPAVTIPAGASNIQIASDGKVSYVPAGVDNVDAGAADSAGAVSESDGAEPDREQLVPGDERQRTGNAGDSRKRQPGDTAAGVCRIEQCGPSQRTGEPDQDATDVLSSTARASRRRIKCCSRSAT